jgi:hypothetical protein
MVLTQSYIAANHIAYGANKVTIKAIGPKPTRVTVSAITIIACCTNSLCRHFAAVVI